MPSLQIPCPKCGKALKLPDRSLLGKKGKCPKCKHAFVMAEPSVEETTTLFEKQDKTPFDVEELYDELEMIEQRRQGEPDEVQMEVVEPAIGQPMTGTSPRWVPDAQPDFVASPAPQPPAPQMAPPGYPYPMPQQAWGAPPQYWPQQYPGQPVMPGYPVPPPGYGQPSAPPAFVPPPTMAPIPAADASPFAPFEETPATASAISFSDEPSVSRPRRKSKSKLKGKQLQLAITVAGGLLLLATVGVLVAQGKLFGSSAKPNGKSVAKVEGGANSDEEDEWEAPLPLTPTKGEPIELFCMPFGVTTVVHLRPADLWAKGSKGEEFRFCLGPLGELLEQQIKVISKHEPSQIEELTLGLMPGLVGEPMQISALVRLKEPAQKSELIKLFKGEYNEAGQYPVYVGDQYAYVIKDLRTFAAAPRGKQIEMAESVNRPNAQASGLEALLKRTDRQRHVVLLFEPSVLEAHVQFILPAEIHAFASQFLAFFNSKQIETVAWSLHVGEKFHSEVLLRNKSVITKTALQQEMKKKLNKLPHEMLAAVEKMDPKVLGPRQIIGRFPAMMKVFAMTTHPSSGERFAALTTSLPERAAPNLAIGALFTWDESTRTDFSKSAAPTTGPKGTDSKLPDLVVDRLKQLKVEIEFNRTPIQDCIKFIGDECKVVIDIDGDGLKDAGFTKNMPQTITLGKVTGLEAIAGVLKKYAKEAKPLVLVIEEAKKRALITTKTFAEKNNQTIFELP